MSTISIIGSGLGHDIIEITLKCKVLLQSVNDRWVKFYKTGCIP